MTRTGIAAGMIGLAAGAWLACASKPKTSDEQALPPRMRDSVAEKRASQKQGAPHSLGPEAEADRFGTQAAQERADDLRGAQKAQRAVIPLPPMGSPGGDAGAER